MAARRYVRDNRGRFATVGATARGGRLATASGGKRATQTKAVVGGRPKGTVGKPKGLKPAAKAKSSAQSKPDATFRPGRGVRGNFRPENTMGKFKKSDDNFGKNTDANVLKAMSDVRSRGLEAGTVKNPKAGIAYGSHGGVTINEGAKFWSNPRAEMRAMRRSGHISTSNPRGVMAHESAHANDRFVSDKSWRSAGNQKLAGRVSRYAAKDSREFVAEARAGLETGRKYDHKVMRAYRQETRTKAKSIRSQLAPKPKAKRGK